MILFLKKLNMLPHIQVKYIRCDNAGENKSFDKENILANLNLTFEYTSPGSPQYNGKVERKFATLYGRVRSMLNAANLSSTLRRGLWAEAAQTATDIENSLVSANKDTPAHTRFYNQSPPITYFHPFGESTVVKKNASRKIRNKLENRGRVCIYLGRAPNHSNDVFRFLNLDTYNVIVSRDVTWLAQNYGQWKGISGVVIQPDDDGTNDEMQIDTIDDFPTKQ
jgi:hypothetical protein